MHSISEMYVARDLIWTIDIMPVYYRIAALYALYSTKGPSWFIRWTCVLTFLSTFGENRSRFVKNLS